MSRPGHRALLVIVPSRSRPAAAVELANMVALHGTRCADVIVATDTDDPTLPEYKAGLEGHPAYGQWLFHATLPPTEARMGGVLNRVAAVNAKPSSPWRYIGFMGDDHRPRTHGWDRAAIDAMDAVGPGVVAYGDDRFQGERLPTHVFMDKRIVAGLGWMAPPQLRHLFLDDFWRMLGTALGTLTYMPQVVVEHMHPHAGKGTEDEGYRRAWESWEGDRELFEQYMRGPWTNDLRRLAAALPMGVR